MAPGLGVVGVGAAASEPIMMRIHRTWHRYVWTVLAPLLAFGLVLSLRSRAAPLVQLPLGLDEPEAHAEARP